MDWRDALPAEMEGLWMLGPADLVADARGDVRIGLVPAGGSNPNPAKTISVKGVLCPWLAEPHPTHLFLVKSRLHQAKPGAKGTWKILTANSAYGLRSTQ